MSGDRTVRFLKALDGASTSRVLNLGQVARNHALDPEHAARPLFLSPAINTAFILKHRMRSDESYLFTSLRSVATKIIVPFDIDDLKTGGRSLFIDQRGFAENLRILGRYKDDETLQRDLTVLRLMNGLPSLDPFLLREHLVNNGVDVAPCYFEISGGDQKRMRAFVAEELSQLMQLANGADKDGSTNRMVSALLSNRVDEKLEPLRVTLSLTDSDFREGVFSWRGFLYYKWAMRDFWPHVMAVLRELKDIQPHGPLTSAQRVFLGFARRSVIQIVRDNGRDVDKALDVYTSAFRDLTHSQSPRTFRDFLLSAPYMFLELGEKMGAISHIVSFWRYRFPAGAPRHVDAEELSAIFQDFLGGLGERARPEEAVAEKPVVTAAN